MKLEQEDRFNTLYPKLMEHYTDKLNKLRMQLESDSSDTLTANLRGRITEVKSLISLLEDKTLENKKFEVKM